MLQMTIYDMMANKKALVILSLYAHATHLFWESIQYYNDQICIKEIWAD